MNDEIKMIPIEQIRILNPRHRDRRRFELIVESIKNLGLKKPIQVSLRGHGHNGDAGYDLVCGQGRMEAFLALGYKEIPAIVIEATPEERLLRSLVENIARRQPSPTVLIEEIERLRERGYTIEEVAAKLDVAAAVATSGALPENVNYAVKSSLLLSFLESVPQVSARLRKPNASERKFEQVAREAQDAAALVLVY